MHWKNLVKQIKEHENLWSLLFALLALGISVRGCIDSNNATSYARKAYELSEKQEVSKSLILLKGGFPRRESYFKVSPFDENFSLQYLRVNFPTDLSPGIWESDGSNKKIPLLQLETELTDYLKKSLIAEKVDENHVGLYKGYVPIVIQTNYVLEGRVYGDSSLYAIHYTSFISQGGKISSDIEFLSLSFLRRLSLEQEVEALLNHEWRIRSL